MTAEERARHLVDILLGNEASPGLHEKILRCFLEPLDSSVRDEALMAYVEKLKPNRKPTNEDRARFRELLVRLGLEVDEPRPATVSASLGRRTMMRRVALRAAALLLPVLLMTGGVFLWNNLRNDGGRLADDVTASVTRNESDTLLLPDGSSVKVKKGGMLAYGRDFMRNRRVTLDGEAFFSVVHDGKHPFTVESGDVKVTVLGTEFNVNAYRDEAQAEVILTSGSVSVMSGGSLEVLVPNQKATIDRGSHEIKLSAAGKGEILRICGKSLSFDDMRVDEALKTAADYFGKELVVRPGAPMDDYININVSASGKPALEDILLSICQISGSIKYKIEDDTIIVSRK